MRLRLIEEHEVLTSASLHPAPVAKQILERLLPPADVAITLGRSPSHVRLELPWCESMAAISALTRSGRSALAGAAMAEGCVTAVDRTISEVEQETTVVDWPLTIAELAYGFDGVETADAQQRVVRTREGVEPGTARRRPGSGDDADDRRLQADVPPHHG